MTGERDQPDQRKKMGRRRPARRPREGAMRGGASRGRPRAAGAAQGRVGAQAPAAKAGGGLCGIKPALGGFCGEGCLTHKNALGGPARARRCRRDDRPGGAPAGQTQDSWAPADLRTAVQYRPLKTSSESTGDGSRRRRGHGLGLWLWLCGRPCTGRTRRGGGFQNVRRGLPLSGRASPPLLC